MRERENERKKERDKEKRFRLQSHQRDFLSDSFLCKHSAAATAAVHKRVCCSSLCMPRARDLGKRMREKASTLILFSGPTRLCDS